MKPITKGQFLFFQQIGHPYSGPVEGMGWVVNKPFIAVSDSPDNGASSDGTFLLPKEEPFIIVSDNTSVQNKFYPLKKGGPELEHSKNELKRVIKEHFQKKIYDRDFSNNQDYKPRSPKDIHIEEKFTAGLNDPYKAKYQLLIQDIDESILFLDNVPQELYLYPGLKRYFDNYFYDCGYEILEKRREIGKSSHNIAGIGTSILGGGLSIASEFVSKDGKMWYCPLQNKMYRRDNFWKNQYTIHQKHAVATHKVGNWGGKGLGLYSITQHSIEYFYKEEINATQFVMEIAVDMGSTWGGLYGAAFGIGWELGREISTQKWYKDKKDYILYQYWRRKTVKW